METGPSCACPSLARPAALHEGQEGQEPTRSAQVPSDWPWVGKGTPTAVPGRRGPQGPTGLQGPSRLLAGWAETWRNPVSRSPHADQAPQLQVTFAEAPPALGSPTQGAHYGQPPPPAQPLAPTTLAVSLWGTAANPQPREFQATCWDGHPLLTCPVGQAHRPPGQEQKVPYPPSHFTPPKLTGLQQGSLKRGRDPQDPPRQWRGWPRLRCLTCSPQTGCSSGRSDPVAPNPRPASSRLGLISLPSPTSSQEARGLLAHFTSQDTRARQLTKPHRRWDTAQAHHWEMPALLPAVSSLQHRYPRNVHFRCLCIPGAPPTPPGPGSLHRNSSE